jgi:hypothetical protein
MEGVIGNCHPSSFESRIDNMQSVGELGAAVDFVICAQSQWSM